MRIYMLDKDPRTCAQYHTDKHVVGMPKTYAALLCNTYHYFFNRSIREANGQARTDELLTHKRGIPYRENQLDHELSVWTRANFTHFLWLQLLAECLAKEYRHRFGEVQKVEMVLDYTSAHLRHIQRQFALFVPIVPVPTKIKGIARPSMIEVINDHRQRYEDGDYTNRDKPNFLIGLGKASAAATGNDLGAAAS